MNRDPHGIDPDDATRALDQEPSVEGMLKQLGRVLGVDDAQGWGAIDDAGKGLQKQREQATAAFKKEANIFRDTFATADGRKCLNIMIDMTLRTAPFPAEAMLPIDAITPLVIAHHAQCEFVRSILKAIAQADNFEAKRTTRKRK